jgi:hypothetical protein
LPILGKGVVNKKEPVVWDGSHFVDDFVNGAGTKIPSSQKTDTAGETVEFTASGRVNQIKHLDSTVGVKIPLKDFSSRCAHQTDIRGSIHVIVDLF